MKQYLNIVILILTLILNSNINAQEEVIYEDDSLNYYLDQRDYITYFDKITQLGEIAFKHEDEKYLFVLGNLLQQDFEGLNSSQRKELRSTAARIGQKINRLSGDLNEALKIYLVAHNNVENKTTLDSLAWFIENYISNFYTRQGDFEKAAYFSTLVEKSLIHHGMIPLLSRRYSNVGRQLKSEFKIKEAIRVFERGYFIADSVGYDNGIFANAINLAEVYNDYPSMGSSDSYLWIAGKYLPRLEDDDKFKEKTAIFQFENAKNTSNKGKYAESIPLFKEAIETLRGFYSNTKRRDFAKFYTLLAKSYLLIDSIQASESIIHNGLSSLIPEFTDEQDLPEIRQLYPENSFIDLFVLQAGAYEKQFELSEEEAFLEKALSSIELALYVNDLIRESVIADPSKLVTVQSNKELMQKAISIVYRLHTMDDNQTYLDKARSYFNRSKSLLFDEKTRRNNLVNILSKEDKEKLAALQNEIRGLHEEKFGPQADINALNGKILYCQEQIEGIFSAYDHIPLTIHKPEFYIEYFMSDDEIYAFSEVQDHKQFILVGRQKDFQALSNRLRDFILQKGLSMDESILNEMYAFLIRALNVQLPADLVIIPDGTIGYVPFEMLMDDQGKYLLESTTISYLFEYLTYDHEGTVEAKKLNVFCLAPQYKMKEVKKAEVMRGSVYHLPYAKMEVDSIQALYGVTALVSQSGDKAEWENNISHSRVFHYAGHAIIDSDNAFLVLHDGNDEQKQLTGKEIGLMHHTLDMVVLSACETGLGKLEHGEGIRSLGRSFMESGAKATVISLWNVNDKSTALIMTSFYKNLRAGMEKDAALRQSKLDYLKNAPARYVHPYFWAAFIPAGNMDPLD